MLSALRVVLGLSAVLLGAYSASAASADCYRIVLKEKSTGALFDMGCPAVTCDGTPPPACPAHTFVAHHINPATNELEPADAVECLCGGIGNKPCNLYAYRFGESGIDGWACRQRSACPSATHECESPEWITFSDTHDRRADCTCKPKP